MVGTGWLRVGLVSQLVMRSFDVADKGELNKGDGPVGRRSERTPDHSHHSKAEGKREKKGDKGKKYERRQEAAPEQDTKASSQGQLTVPTTPTTPSYCLHACQAFHFSFVDTPHTF